MQPTSAMRIIDLGGDPRIWDHVDRSLDITCLNLPGVANEEHPTHHRITFVEGDACDLPEFQPGDFDMVFSNSVIEHVGPLHKRVEFADEVLRLSDVYWVQTPSKWFPIEAHCGMPFWWFYPHRLRSFFLRRWRKKLPAWTEMVATTTVVDSGELRTILPGCTIKHETFFGIPKSLIAYSTDTRNTHDTSVPRWRSAIAGRKRSKDGRSDNLC
jgi:hypothetical protein